MTKVFVLIPTHNRRELIKKCLQSIQKQTYKNRETVVIDDGSTDGTSKMIKKEFPETTILEGDGTLWWTGAMRMGVGYTLGGIKDGDFVLLMNDDTVFGPEYLQSLVDVSKRHNRAIIGSICFDAKDEKSVVEAGVVMNWMRGRLDVPLKLPKDYKKRKTREVDTFCGRGTLVPIEVFQKIGSYSRRLPHYISDYEFFIRAKRASFKLLISYESVTYSTKEAGGIKFKLQKMSWKRFLNELFSRRSKSNIIDRINFIILASPKELRTRNLKRVIRGFLFRLSFVVPFYYKRGLVMRMRARAMRIVKLLRGLIWCLKRKLRGLPC